MRLQSPFQWRNPPLFSSQSTVESCFQHLDSIDHFVATLPPNSRALRRDMSPTLREAHLCHWSRYVWRNQLHGGDHCKALDATAFLWSVLKAQ
jgi:hypothetical protein